MKRYDVHVASQINGDDPVEPGELAFCAPLPPFETIEHRRIDAVFEEDAEIIVSAMERHLPQGTRWRVLIKLLQRTGNSMVVR